MDFQTIDKFLNNELDPEHRTVFIQWLHSPESEKTLKEYMHIFWMKRHDSLFEEYDEQKLYSELLTKINQSIPDEKNIAKVKFRTSYLKFAATITGLLLVSLAVYLTGNTINNDTTISSVVSISKKTTAGQRLTFSTFDGSVITLNSNSEIHYLQNDSARIVRLQGEAFFEVAENPELPFTVIGGALHTTALGTAFNVLSRPDKNCSYVSLINGRVEVQSDNNEYESLLLIPGEQVVYNNLKKSIAKKEWDYNKVFGWKDGILYFDDVKLEEIITKLQNWYGVSFEIEKIKNSEKHYSGKYDNEPLENVLESLSFIYGFKYKINEKEVKINF